MTDKTLAFDELGTGPVVVLLHAGVCDRRMWDAVIGPLAEAGYRVLRCDFRGFGDTPAPEAPYNDGDDVLALLDELGVDRCALVGSSFGGKVALEIAARRPDRVGALVLLCAGMPGHEPSSALREFWTREEELFERGDIEAAVELNVGNWVGPHADDAARDLVRQMQRRAFELRLAASEEVEPIAVDVDLAAIEWIPTEVAWGTEDLPDFHEIAEQLTATLPNAWLVELPGAGHLPSLEQPRETLPVIRGFLQELYRG